MFGYDLSQDRNGIRTDPGPGPGPMGTTKMPIVFSKSLGLLHNRLVDCMSKKELAFVPLFYYIDF